MNYHTLAIFQFVAFFTVQTIGVDSSTCLGGSKPYYFGTTSLICISKRIIRSAPYRSTWMPTHRWIYYDGFYFEWGVHRSEYFQDFYGKHPTGYKTCTTKRETQPAGYSNLSVECLKKCTKSYRKQYGGYNIFPIFGNNCHHFANRMSEILCNRSTCPSWCI